ncbi:MAG: glycoside hydrolase family 2 protein [Clostridia bacterium]|nr:glycoside hydrolase family 2 protein [Clostridia bacterium]
MIIKNWTMSFLNYNLKCTAPCSMYSVLLENGLIDDPFYGINNEKLTSLSDNDCEFEAVFNAERDVLENKNKELVFYGLDTYCDIYLNGVLLDTTMNMHRTFSYDVSSLVKEGKNSLKLYFHSPTKYCKEMNHRQFLYTTEDAIPGSSHLRKPVYMSGWDWGPQLPDMGIFRDVELVLYNYDKIEDFEVLQYHEDGKVRLEISVSTKKNKNYDCYAHIDGKKIKLENGRGTVIIDNPRLWWVRGYGEQPLYDLKLTLEKDGRIIDEINKKIGLRTIDVSVDNDKYGKEFAFVVNGVKIFAMGANYIPCDNLTSRITTEKIKKVIDSAVFANYNCLRIWGGGYYPEDEFYDICDEYGILVWQDFMVACSDIWLTPDMKENFMEEAKCNIKRLRHHASLGILCGNNENEEQIYAGEWGDSFRIKAEYVELYENLLAHTAYKYAPQIFYWPSSPSAGGGFANTKSPENGDVHIWDVWAEDAPIENYRKYKYRFVSEFGFESFPSIKTIETFCGKKDMNPVSRVIDAHQKSIGGTGRMLKYLAEYYPYAYSFEDMIYASQLMQAEAIKYGVEYFRKIRECCKGALYWQINDCWPGSSWSSTDYYGRFKALHYMSKKFYAPVLSALFYKDGKIGISVINETMDTFKGKIKAGLCKNNFDVIWEKEIPVEVDSLVSKEAGCFEINPENAYDTYFYIDFYDKEGNFIMRQTELFVRPKHFEWLEPDIKVTARKDSGAVRLSFTSKNFAKGVYADFDDDIILSDNWFDITNNKPYEITAYTDLPAETLLRQIKIKSVYDIGR